MLLCLGDSLTFGSVGYSYIDFLKPCIKAVNKGVNGDTTNGALRRLKRYIKNPRYSQADTYVVFIGVNDILKPFITTLSPLWWLLMKPRVFFKKCIADDSKFQAQYEIIIKLLESCGKKVILVGLPSIQIKNADPGPYIRRSAIIKALAEKHGIPFIDIYSKQTEAAKSPNELNKYSWGFSSLLRVTDAAAMLLFTSSKDWFSKKRGLELTVDGIHFNSLSAKLLAEEINKLIWHHYV